MDFASFSNRRPYKEDEILFRAISPGGTSLASDQDRIAAETAEQVIAEGGLGQFSSLDLDKVLAGASTGVRADIDETEEGLRGGAARKDVEKMFQLIYLTFTAPRADPVQFEALKARLRPMLANQQARPETAFRDALVSALTQDHPRARPLTAASVDQMNLDRSMAFYKSRFADASDFTFVFVGSFDVPAMKPLVERYLASLPSIHRVEAAVDRRRPPAARGGGTAGRQRGRPQKSGGHRLQRTISERPAASVAAQDHEPDARRQSPSARCARISAAPTVCRSSRSFRSIRPPNTRFRSASAATRPGWTISPPLPGKPFGISRNRARRVISWRRRAARSSATSKPAFRKMPICSTK